MDYKGKRERSANFITAEIQLLVNLVDKHKDVIENKKTDAVTNKDKESAWKQIENSFNSCSLTTNARSWKTLKLKYEGIKKSTKKKSAQHRQEMYKTGGGRSDAPELLLDEEEEKVLSICSNITGLEARYDSDSISDKNESMSLKLYRIIDNGDSQKEKKLEKWQPKALKSNITKVLKPGVCNKASVTSKLSEARLELVNLQMQTTREQHEFVEKEHNLKMLHLANDERRKEEIHKLLLEKIKLDLRQVQ